MRLIVGLGNPGEKYIMTRHNTGMLFVDKIAEHYQTDWSYENKFEGFIADITTNDGNFKLLKPTTFMNCSGRSVSAVAKYYKILPKEILVIHDELDLPLGKLKFKFAGTTNGHNGLKDIEKSLETNEFYRLRIGIDRPTRGLDVASYVLANISKNIYDKIIFSSNEVINVIPNILANDMDKVMHKIHTNNK